MSRTQSSAMDDLFDALESGEAMFDDQIIYEPGTGTGPQTDKPSEDHGWVQDPETGEWGKPAGVPEWATWNMEEKRWEEFNTHQRPGKSGSYSAMDWWKLDGSSSKTNSEGKGVRIVTEADGTVARYDINGEPIEPTETTEEEPTVEELKDEMAEESTADPEADPEAEPEGEPEGGTSDNGGAPQDLNMNMETVEDPGGTSTGSNDGNIVPPGETPSTDSEFGIDDTYPELNPGEDFDWDGNEDGNVGPPGEVPGTRPDPMNEEGNGGRIWVGDHYEYPRPDGTYGPEPYIGGSVVGPDGTITWPWAPGSSMGSDGVITNPTGVGTGTGGNANIGDINIDLGGREDGEGNLEPRDQGHMSTADAIKLMEINAAREKAAREQQAAFDKSAREAASKSEALAGQRLINQDKWGALGGLMGMLGNQRKSLYTDLKGPIGYANTTTGGYGRYQDASPEDGGRGPVVGAGDQPGRISAPSSSEVASALGSAPKASSDLQQQIADAMGGAAAPEAASMVASMGQSAEANEMAAKSAASKQGLDLAKIAYDLGNKKRNLRQGLDQSTVAAMTPMIAAKTPDVVKYS